MIEEQEHPCTACSNGMITIPKMEMDSKGNPVVIQEVITCIVCGGNGRVRY